MQLTSSPVQKVPLCEPIARFRTTWTSIFFFFFLSQIDQLVETNPALQLIRLLNSFIRDQP